MNTDDIIELLETHTVELPALEAALREQQAQEEN